jgi:hypothetical protein
LDKLKNVTIRILHKGDDRCTAFDRTRLPSNVATNGPKFLHQLVNLKTMKHNLFTAPRRGIKNIGLKTYKHSMTLTSSVAIAKCPKPVPISYEVTP